MWLYNLYMAILTLFELGLQLSTLRGQRTWILLEVEFQVIVMSGRVGVRIGTWVLYNSSKHS